MVSLPYLGLQLGWLRWLGPHSIHVVCHPWRPSLASSWWPLGSQWHERTRPSTHSPFLSLWLCSVCSCPIIQANHMSKPRFKWWRKRCCLLMEKLQNIVTIFLKTTYLACMASPGGSAGKEPPCQCRRHGFNPLVRKIWRKKWQPTPFLPGKFHGQRNPWGHKGLDTTEHACTTLHIWKWSWFILHLDWLCMEF